MAIERRDQPDRPRLRIRGPLLQRRGDVLQVGIDAERVGHLEQCPPGLEQVLTLLDGAHSQDALRRAGLRIGLATDLLDDLLAQLLRAGLVIDRSHDGAGRSPAAIRVIGAGRLGRAVATLLFSSELTHLEVVDDNPIDSGLYPGHQGTGGQAAALATVLDGMRTETGRFPRLVLGRHWSTLGALTHGARPASLPEPRLSIVTTERLELDRVVVDALLRADQPHLVVRGSGDGVVVGPLVWPGRSACVRCTDLVRRDLDPEWPSLLPQLCRLPATLSATAVGWAAGVAAAQALAALARAPETLPETAGATVELSTDYTTRWRSWPRHPECGCSWAGTPV